MRKTMFIIALFAAALVFFTASTTNAIDGKIGHSAPNFRLTSDTNESFELNEMKGNWVLLDFWTSTDATSRINARRYSVLEDSLTDIPGNHPFYHVSINMDTYQELYREIARHDGIAAKIQFHADSDRVNQLIDQYHLSAGMNTFLIDPMGYVVAINPTEKTIHSLINS